MREAPAPSLPATLARGQRRSSHDRVVKNGGWAFVTGVAVHLAGGGDLSLKDLEDIVCQLGPAEAFLALPEREAYPAGGHRSRLAALVTDGDIDEIAARASFALFEDGVFAVDHFEERGRSGLLPVRPGYRVTSTMRMISRAPIRMPALSTVELQERLRSLAAGLA